MNHKQMILAAIDRDWLHLYPEWVQETFKRALQSEILPAYAQVQLTKAIKVAKAINTKMDKQVNAEVPQTKTKGHRKNSSKASFDRELRMAMKGKSGGKTQMVTNPNSRKALKQARLNKNRK